jgi:hypothetical protein
MGLICDGGNRIFDFGKAVRLCKLPLDGSRDLPIIERISFARMNTSLFGLSLIIDVLAVLIIKDLILVGMAKVKTK